MLGYDDIDKVIVYLNNTVITKGHSKVSIKNHFRLDVRKYETLSKSLVSIQNEIGSHSCK